MTDPGAPWDARPPQDARPPVRPRLSRFRSKRSRPRGWMIGGCSAVFAVVILLSALILYAMHNADREGPPPAPASLSSTSGLTLTSTVPGSGSGSAQPPQFVSRITVPLNDLLTITLNESYPYFRWVPLETPGAVGALPTQTYQATTQTSCPTPTPTAPSTASASAPPAGGCFAESVDAKYPWRTHGVFTVELALVVSDPAAGSLQAQNPATLPCPASLTVPPPAQQDGCKVATYVVYVTVTTAPSPSAHLTFPGAAE